MAQIQGFKANNSKFEKVYDSVAEAWIDIQPVKASTQLKGNNPLKTNQYGKPYLMLQDKAGDMYHFSISGPLVKQLGKKTIMKDDILFDYPISKIAKWQVNVDLNGNTIMKEGTDIPTYKYVDGKRVPRTDDKGNQLFGYWITRAGKDVMEDVEAAELADLIALRDLRNEAKPVKGTV